MTLTVIEAIINVTMWALILLALGLAVTSALLWFVTRKDDRN